MLNSDQIDAEMSKVVAILGKPAYDLLSDHHEYLLTTVSVKSRLAAARTVTQHVLDLNGVVPPPHRCALLRSLRPNSLAY